MGRMPLNSRARRPLCVIDDAGHSDRAPVRYWLIHMNPTKNDNQVSVVCKRSNGCTMDWQHLKIWIGKLAREIRMTPIGQGY